MVQNGARVAAPRTTCATLGPRLEHRLKAHPWAPSCKQRSKPEQETASSTLFKKCFPCPTRRETGPQRNTATRNHCATPCGASVPAMSLKKHARNSFEQHCPARWGPQQKPEGDVQSGITVCVSSSVGVFIWGFPQKHWRSTSTEILLVYQLFACPPQGVHCEPSLGSSGNQHLAQARLNQRYAAACSAAPQAATCITTGPQGNRPTPNRVHSKR